MKVIIEGRPEEIAALLSGGTGRREAERRVEIKLRAPKCKIKYPDLDSKAMCDRHTEAVGNTPEHT